MTPPVPAPDSVTTERARYAREVLTSIAGHESEPAGQVFKNVKALTDIPASRLVAIMNNGYGRSLGVSCTHCHVAGQWDSDSKPQKQIARDMAQMVVTINGQLLANIKNLKGPQAIVNCTTCHRGAVKPALNMQ
ncbi:MAG TPA: c-type cytochrome [Gemmatimonadaceae bacterium]|nr:c-type cytochrome [Gemmatimonadaceae bacterium]